ncbi:MAG: glycoside hydrolase family 30 beta sandwich domain-containing protein [Microbacteriaceae bacterium]
MSLDTAAPVTTGTDRLTAITTTFRGGSRETTERSTPFEPDEGAEFFVVNVHPEIRYQTIRGFGGAITESAGYALARMSPERQQQILDAYFGPAGNRYSVVRSHIDSSDFSLGTYEAVPTDDPSLESFSLERDERYLLPLLRRAQERRGAPLEVMLSPWSPPAYMKTNGSRVRGGSLRPEYRERWARYLARYVAEYRALGFDVNRITVQNEPDASQAWDSCRFTADQERVFLRDFLHPALVAAGLDGIGVHIWDHNKERMYERAVAVLDDETLPLVAGVAFHWYTGDHFDALRLVRERFPALDLAFTEGCVEYSRLGTDQLANAQMYAHDIIGNLNAGMNLFLDWNIVLDERGGPNHADNFCEAPIMCDPATDTVEVKLSHCYIGHFSRHIQPGARRIATSSFSSRIELVAVRNPDATIVIVAMNPGEEDVAARVRLGGRLASLHLPPQSISTAVTAP